MTLTRHLMIVLGCLCALRATASGQGEKVAPTVTPAVSYFIPGTVRLNEGPLLDLQRQGERYLLRLQPDSLLHFVRTEAGLVPKARPYGGWESCNVWGAGPLRGGFVGYYLSGLALMYRTTGNPILLERLRYTLAELDTCRRAGGDGYIMGIRNGRALFRDVAAGKIKTDNPTVNGSWAPLYLIDKTMRGLAIAYVTCGEERALTLLTGLADWFGREVIDRLDDDQLQRLLICEHGSINLSYVETYALTGDKRYLEWGRRLHDRAMWEPLSQNRDILLGWHANTQIPKFIGFERYYAFTGDERFDRAARAFWEIVTGRHSWVIGGNSAGEFFFPVGEFEKKMLSGGGPETCNSANMMRLTEALFAYTPTARMADFYERVLLNHILPAYDPQRGMCCYFTPMRPAHYRIYGSEEGSFWCCNQSGLETPAKLTRFVFTRQGDDPMVNLFVPATLEWKERGMRLEQQASMPESGRVVLRFRPGNSRDVRLLVRRPGWGEKAAIRVNGRTVVPTVGRNGYWEIETRWKKENTIEIDFPLQLRTEPLPGSDRYAALLYGPYVLAGRMGTENLPASFWAGIDNIAHNKIPVPDRSVLPAGEPPLRHIVRRSERPLTFGIDAPGYGQVSIEPFYRIHFERYTLYWPLGTAPEE